ncbi:MATH/TRAF domain [Arabidopsis suecica]|uniref:MATH/TRAF domain n=1 Tax=Arabidopsis suecica TaxID=45249 RepID=A0A8T2E6U9_ARASU|nr:MATH/TRAF domain [Arabidopsis suecica]
MSRPIPIEEMVRLFKIRHTTSHLFKIDNFSLLKKHGIEKVESSVFDLAGHKWKLSVYPNGHKNAKGTHVSMFLVNQVPVNDMPTYELLVVSQLERKWHTHGRDEFDINPEPASEGFLRFISLADLERKGFLIGDCCMVGVKFHGIEPANPGTAECFSLIEKPLNHKVTWMMSKFSSFNPGKAHQSNEFVVGTRKWRLEVHPRGYMDEKDKSFSVYLSAEGFVNNAPMTKTYAKFKLRVLDQVSWNHVEESGLSWFDAEPSDQSGFADFMPLGKLNEPYLVKDKLYVGVEFEVVSTTYYC